MDSDFRMERQALEAVPNSKEMVGHHSSFSYIFNTIDTIICDEPCYTGEFREMSSKNAFGEGPGSIMDGSFCADPAFSGKLLQRPSFSALMADETSDADPFLDSGKDSGDLMNEGQSVSILSNSVNLNTLGLKYDLNSTGWNHFDAEKLGAEVSKFNIGSLTFPSDPAFVERAAKYSSYGNAERIGPENVASGGSNLGPVTEQGRENTNAASSESTKVAYDSLGKKRRSKSLNNTKESEETKAKRCRVEENSESDDDNCNDNASECTPKKGKDKNSKPVQKDDNYIHVRARRGQATDSHSLAERVRREKINERMKFLQDLVPTCNKVTGKAVMLDEIINYVQSLQHQVEFLSMKLATVNPKRDFNIDNFFAKEMCGSVTSKGVPPPYFHTDQFKQASLQIGLSPGSDILSAITSADSAEMFDGENFQRQSPSGGNNHVANMYNMELLHSRVLQQQQQQQQQPPL